MGGGGALLGSALLFHAHLAAADMVLIAHPKSGVERLSRDEVVNIYLGRYRRLTDSLGAEPIDLPAEHEAKALFYRRLVGKSLPEINAYWARLVFSGKTSPPFVASSAEEALQRVASRPSALAYVDRTRVDKRVVIVFDLGE